VVKLAEYFGVEEKDLLIAWLSDKLVHGLADEEVALKALQVAEEKLEYRIFQKFPRRSVMLPPDGGKWYHPFVIPV